MAVAIGAEIAYWRRKRGLSRIQLGERVGRSGNTIGRYERAATTPDVTETWAIARALNVPLTVLCERAEQSADVTGDISDDPPSTARHSSPA